jgi:acetyl-CoA carboxylase carboxyl transferase subunit beta
MSWISNVVRPKIRSLLNKREVPQNLWIKCPETGEMVFHRDLELNQFVIPGSGYHMRMTAAQRLEHFFDGGRYDTLEVADVPLDPLKFRDERRYTERLRDARAKTGATDAVVVASGTVENVALIAAVQDFEFMGGSLGMAAGEAIIAGMNAAAERKVPFVMFAASGGARMQEGAISLMQMGKLSAALMQLDEARLPYISILTDPTAGGVTASFAMLGDLNIAEPGALIGFAGPRVIEQTIRQKLPEGFQRSEFLLEHGFLDAIVRRNDLKNYVSSALNFFLG